MATIAEAFGRKWTIGILSHAVAVYVIDLLVSDMCSCCIPSHAVTVFVSDLVVLDVFMLHPVSCCDCSCQ